MSKRWEQIRTPYVTVALGVDKVEQLESTLGDFIRCDALKLALRQGLRMGRRFWLTPAPKDWIE